MSAITKFLIVLVALALYERSHAALQDFFAAPSSAGTVATADPHDYGVDVSCPIHYNLDRNKVPYAYERYAETMKGCYERYSKRECDASERTRLAMNRDQPKTQHNYTEIGFKKLRAPTEAWEPLVKFYEAFKSNSREESWPRGNSYVNHWKSPSHMVSFEDTSLRGGLQVKNRIWNGIKPIIEEWVGHKVKPTSLYGIRVYHNDAILATHVDRLPLVSSCIIQVDQDLDEPWPIEVYSHAGKAYNVTMQPGDMVLYESHTVLHGRPFPMKGRHYANVFVHFEPVDHKMVNKQDAEKQLLLDQENQRRIKEGKNPSFFGNLLSSADKVFKNNVHRHIGGHEQSQHDEDHLQEHLEAIDREELEQQLKQQLAKHKGEENTKNEETEEEDVDDDEDEEDEEDEEGEGIRPLRFHTVTSIAEKRRQKDLALLSGSRDRKLPATVPASKKDDTVSESEFITTEDAKEAALRYAASHGDHKKLMQLLDVSHLHTKDENDWQLLHEAVRSGEVEAVKFLVDSGADLGAKVKNGGSALWLSKKYWDVNHPVTEYLFSIGAPDDLEL